MKYSEKVKGKLTNILSKMSKNSSLFVKNPNRDFTRDRKIKFDDIIRMLLSMGGSSIGKELLEYFEYDEETATSSAFIQQRNKILSFALEFLLSEFTNSFTNYKKYKGYRLLAGDGSVFNIARNPEDENTYIKGAGPKGFNQLHLNGLYDVVNKIYVDAYVQGAREKSERIALNTMVDRSPIKDDAIVIADRGYEGYNVFAHIEQKHWKYLVRVKDATSNGITSGLNLPNDKEFDVRVNKTLTKKQTNEVKSEPLKYKFVPSTSTFDYLDLYDNQFYDISFRVVRFKISENTFETVITNLDEVNFPATELKKLYHMRWGIETSFRELKYAIGLVNFHTKKVEYIVQEIFARLVMYNFCEIITMHVIIKQKRRKHVYQVNFTMGIHVCKRFFGTDISPPNVEALISKYILPVRKGRKDPRKIKPKTAISFTYRVA